MKIGVIGGTGIYDPTMLENVYDQEVATEYGQVVVTAGTYGGHEVYFLPRHGADHALPPHKVNYRANVKALMRLGVKKIIATAAVGSLNLDLRPGEMVIVDQFLDFTKSRVQTFYEGGDPGVVHIDMTYPYCVSLRREIIKAAIGLGLPVHERGTYVCTEGPRFETPAEIKMFQKLGGEVVGMTSVPEVVLAREGEMCYASISMVTNFAAGIAPTPLTHAEVVEAMEENVSNIRAVIKKVIEGMPEDGDCPCYSALGELGSLGKKE